MGPAAPHTAQGGQEGVTSGGTCAPLSDSRPSPRVRACSSCISSCAPGLSPRGRAPVPHQRSGPPRSPSPGRWRHTGPWEQAGGCSVSMPWSQAPPSQEGPRAQHGLRGAARGCRSPPPPPPPGAPSRVRAGPLRSTPEGPGGGPCPHIRPPPGHQELSGGPHSGRRPLRRSGCPVEGPGGEWGGPGGARRRVWRGRSRARRGGVWASAGRGTCRSSSHIRHASARSSVGLQTVSLQETESREGPPGASPPRDSQHGPRHAGRALARGAERGLEQESSLGGGPYTLRAAGGHLV